MARLPLKPPKPDIGSVTSELDSPRPETQPPSTRPDRDLTKLPDPTINLHGGAVARRNEHNEWLPAPKRARRRPPPPVAARHNLGQATAHDAPAPNLPPLILTEEQTEDLGTYVARDSELLDNLDFGKLVELQWGKSVSAREFASYRTKPCNT